MEKYFQYKIVPKTGLCDIKEQKSIQAILSGQQIDLNSYSLVGQLKLNNPNVLSLIKKLYLKEFYNKKEDRAIGALIGLAVGDALGAPLEFKKIQYNKTFVGGMTDGQLKAGQWTDDTSMALCLCDSLLSREQFDPYDNMIRYLNWWYHGYNNAFTYDRDNKNKKSVGLGGNISLSLKRFMEYGEPKTSAGDQQTSGNGSLMRLAPVAIYYYRNIESAMSVARSSSYVTHQGIEAAECCALLSYILVHGINTGDKSLFVGRQLAEKFKSILPSVNYLASSLAEPMQNNNAINPDRNWNWKDPNYQYSPTRSAEKPDYIGSYAMDALTMALHCFFTTNDFQSCVLKAVNFCGDADTVGAIAGQLAGSFYGVSQIPTEWIDAIHKWDGGGTIAYRASLLFNSAN
jgi:ADP-ribosyl-[dinitrogen reductase] hydrolase